MSPLNNGSFDICFVYRTKISLNELSHGAAIELTQKTIADGANIQEVRIIIVRIVFMNFIPGNMRFGWWQFENYFLGLELKKLRGL